MATIEDASQELADESGLRKYVVLDVAEAATARGLVNALAPAIWNSLIKQDVKLTELGGGQWEGEVPYGTPERGEQGDIAWSFNIATQSVKITQALEHIHTYPDGGDPHKGAIGVRDDGNGRTLEGCQVSVPYLTWDEEHWYPAAIVATHSFITTLENLAASCNEKAWRIWQKGELLILGMNTMGSKNCGSDVGIKFRFASSRTKMNQTFGDITGVTKRGHEYLWLEYEEAEVDGIAVQKPVRAHIERVYEYEDWDNLLPLPDPWS